VTQIPLTKYDPGAQEATCPWTVPGGVVVAVVFDGLVGLVWLVVVVGGGVPGTTQFVPFQLDPTGQLKH
jgi:hypothetical protein